MPRKAASGIKGLTKHHACGRRPADPTRCDCNWSGKYRGYEVVLSVWARCTIDPRTKGKAEAVLRRMKQAIDENRFDPAGERPDVTSGERQVMLSAFIEEWTTHYAVPRGLSSNSMASMLGLLARSRLGAMSLNRLAGAAEDIEQWLHATGKLRKWTAKTWNGYHELLNRVLKQAVRWKRMTANPMANIERRVALKPDHFRQRHLEEDVEAKLFAVVEQLNEPVPPTRSKLTWEQADAIRAALAAGKAGIEVARQFKVSPAVVSAIKHGDIWNPDRVSRTKGTEMRRRLIAAFDGGLRAGEMQKIQLQHVNWRPVPFKNADGQRRQGYEIVLPPDLTKGGKTTGETQTVFAGTQRFVQMLEQRRFQLKDHKPSRQFIFGDEAGRYQAGFRRLWRDLFTRAGLTYGRAHGLVWHTVRHEFISRVAENTGDPVLTQEVARHKNLETTQGYFHARRDRRYAAAAGLERG